MPQFPRFLLPAWLLLATLGAAPGSGSGSGGTQLDAASSLVQLYFGAPLLSKRLQASESWRQHDDLSGTEARELVSSIWETYRNAHRKHAPTEPRHHLAVGDQTLTFTLQRRPGSQPDAPLPLTLALHGGGTQRKAETDRQWELQQQRHPNVPGLYVCPRAPTDAWDQWHDEKTPALLEALIRHLLIHEEVDPDRVYLLGYSAGAYGTFFVGAALADRFAAASSSAGAPVEGRTPPEHWQHLPLRVEIGEKDIAYGRVEACRQYEDLLNTFRLRHRGGFSSVFIEHEGQGHQIDDRAAVPWLLGHRRQTRPKALTWIPTSTAIEHHHWLAQDEPTPGQRIEAVIRGNHITLTSQGVRRLRIRLDDQLVDLDRPVTVSANGMKIFEGPVARELRCLVETLEERGDPGLMFCSELNLYIP